MIIAATSDVHSPRFFEEFVKAVDSLNVKPDLLVLAGDMIERGNVAEYEKIRNVFFGKFVCPIVACFGNEEFSEMREEIKEKYKEIKFLDDEATILQIGQVIVGIVGTTGSLDEPTRWQKANVPNIEVLYRNRVRIVDNLLQRMKAHITILLMHYAPSYKILQGENPNFFKNMGSIAYEQVLLERKPTLVINGHSHKGSKMAWVDTVPIFNVSFPLNKEIVVIDTEKDLKPGLTKFIS
ncbi:MAG: metallophosphoesterase [Candidatus Aenigmatarchaeota archaeon]